MDSIKENSIIDSMMIAEIDECFHFLGCEKTDSLEEIRKKFYYKMDYIQKYILIIRRQHMDENNRKKEKESSWETKKLIKYWKLLADSYLAIILVKTQEKNYEILLKSLCIYFKMQYSGTMCFEPLLEEQLKVNHKECYDDVEEYLGDLLYFNQCGGCTTYEYTPSLTSIILFENEILKDQEKVKVLRYSKSPQYEDLKPGN